MMIDVTRTPDGAHAFEGQEAVIAVRTRICPVCRRDTSGRDIFAQDPQNLAPGECKTVLCPCGWKYTATLLEDGAWAGQARKEGDGNLIFAKQAHRARTGHNDIFVGMNFVECLDCGRHAHQTDGRGVLFLHGRPGDGAPLGFINCAEF